MRAQKDQNQPNDSTPKKDKRETGNHGHLALGFKSLPGKSEVGLFAPSRYYSPMDQFRVSSYSDVPSRALQIARYSAMHKVELPKQIRTSSFGIVLMRKMDCIIEPESTGNGGLYLGSLEGAKDMSLLKLNGIKAVLSAIGKAFRPNYDPKDVPEYRLICADDIETYDISQHFEEAFQFLDSARAQTNVLVHCYAGVSRSSTLIVSYLMKKNKWTLNRALEFVKTKRPGVQPNHGFMVQLKTFEGKNFGILPGIESPSRPSSNRKKIFS